MSDNIDKENYLLLLSMYIDLGTETLLSLLLHYINTSVHSGTKNFFNNEEIKKELIKLKNKNILDEHEFIRVYGCIPKLHEFDITLLIKLLTHLFGDKIQYFNKEPGAKDHTIGADLYRLRKLRNKLFHLSKPQLSQNKFEILWEKIKDTMLRVANEIGDDVKEKLEGKIADHKKNAADILAKTKIGKLLEEWRKQYLSMKEKAKDLCKKMDRYGLLLRSTPPKNYIRYLKLLFDCGKRVLLAILSRECDRRKQTLREILGENKERLQMEITNDNDVNQLFPKSSTHPAHERWSLSLLATVILTTFTELDLEEKSKIEHLKNAADETQNPANLLLETDYLFKQSTHLTCSITLLAAGINEETKLFCIRYIDQYPNMEIQDDVTIEKYLKEIKNQGEKIKELDEVHRDLISELKDHLTKMEESGFDFEEPREIQIRIYTICEDKNTEKLVEDNIEEAYQITGSQASLYGVKEELDKLVQRLSSHTDVHVTAMKRNCITLTLSSSSCKGMLQLLDDIESNLQKSCDRLSDEFSYMYNEVVVLWGHIPFESIFYALENQRNNPDTAKTGFNITLESESLEGILHILASLSDCETTSSFNNISEVLSSNGLGKGLGKAPVRVFPCVNGISNLFEDTGSQEEGDIFNGDKNMTEKERQREEEERRRKEEQDRKNKEFELLLRPYREEIERLNEEKNTEMERNREEIERLEYKIKRYREDIKRLNSEKCTEMIKNREEIERLKTENFTEMEKYREEIERLKEKNTEMERYKEEIEKLKKKMKKGENLAGVWSENAAEELREFAGPIGGAVGAIGGGVVGTAAEGVKKLFSWF